MPATTASARSTPISATNFHRVRIGVGKPGDKDMVMSHVLGDFAKADTAWLEPLIERSARMRRCSRARGFATFQNKVHLALNPEAETTSPKKETA